MIAKNWVTYQCNYECGGNRSTSAKIFDREPDGDDRYEWVNKVEAYSKKKIIVVNIRQVSNANVI